jgi:glycosyltransferase involved in cell wall biosynthesis
VILEAYAAGIPVIAFRSGGIPEVLEHGITGYLVDSTEEMARIAIDCLARRSPACDLACRAAALEQPVHAGTLPS